MYSAPRHQGKSYVVVKLKFVKTEASYNVKITGVLTDPMEYSDAVNISIRALTGMQNLQGFDRNDHSETTLVIREDIARQKLGIETDLEDLAESPLPGASEK